MEQEGTEVACRAPFTSMRLEPDGEVLACCQNNWYPLGTITESSLEAIWRGGPATELRAAIAAGRFHLGCEMCGAMVRQGSADAAYARTFDRLPLPDDGAEAWPVQLELALSNACNLECTMCNGDLSSAIRAHREHRPPLPKVYGEPFFAELARFVPHLRYVTFLGGEPFLSPEALRAMDVLVEHNPRVRCHVTTNGTQMNERVERFVTRQPCHIAVSIDGLSAAVNERIRVGTDHAAVLRNIERFRSLTAGRDDSAVSLAFCLMRDNATEFGALLGWAAARDLDVFVNRVLSPSPASLFHLPLHELDSVVAELEAQGADPSFAPGRNRAVWDRELAALHHHADDLRRAASVASVTVRGRSSAAPADAIVTVGPDQLVREVWTGPRWAWGDLDAVVGRGPVEILHLLLATLGELRSTELTFEDGLEVRRMSFDAAGGRRPVQAVLGTEPSGEHRWEITIGEVQPTP